MWPPAEPMAPKQRLATEPAFLRIPSLRKMITSLPLYVPETMLQLTDSMRFFQHLEMVCQTTVLLPPLRAYVLSRVVQQNVIVLVQTYATVLDLDIMVSYWISI